MKFNTIKFKISILYTAILGLILLVFISAVYLSISYTLYTDLDNELTAKAEQIAVTINTYMDLLGREDQTFRFAANRALLFSGDHPGPEKISGIEEAWRQQVTKLDLYDDLAAVADTDGTLLACSDNVPPDLLRLYFKRLHQTGLMKPTARNISYRQNVMRWIILPVDYQGSRGYTVLLGTSLKPAIRTLRKQLPVVAGLIAIILVLSVFIGRFLARRMLKPVEEIARTAHTITFENLAARVETAHTDEEIESLTRAFNAMIERLEHAFEHISDFSSNVSHELKTPLAIIRGQCEVALRQEGSEAKYRQVILANIEQVKRMLKIINDLFLLARLDFRPELFALETTGLNEFISEIYEQSKLLAEGKQLTITLNMPEEELAVEADTVHLRRLFMNIVDNAVKFTPAKGTVKIAVELRDTMVTISITDTGAGIAKDDLPRVFDRFFHKQQRGTESLPGEGLGLSLSLAIARLHGGGIAVESTPGEGAAFTVTLPVVKIYP